MNDDKSVREAEPTEQLQIASGLGLLLIIAITIVTFQYIGAIMLGLKSFFASFTLLWYWGNVEKAQLRGLVPSVVGSVVGVGLAWVMRSSIDKFGLIMFNATRIPSGEAWQSEYLMFVRASGGKIVEVHERMDTLAVATVWNLLN